MKKKYFKVFSISFFLLVLSCLNSGCSCNDKGKVKVTFVSDRHNDIVRYVKKGESLSDIPATPVVKDKYCLWDRESFDNLEEDIIVRAECHSSVTSLTTNIPSVIDVDVFSNEADLDYIFKDIEVEATFQNGDIKKLYKGDYILDANNYNKNVSGSYVVSIKHNNAKQDITINVNKIKNYVTVSLNGGNGYYGEGLPQLFANTNVKGDVKFDKGQVLEKGDKIYSWTFTPEDTNKYEIVKGNINVTLLDASAIVSDKNSFTFDYGTDKQTIVNTLKQELVVMAKYGEYYREVSSDFYSIESPNFSINQSGKFTFKIIHNEYIFKEIEVVINKCDDYLFEVTDIEEFVYSKGDSLVAIEEDINKVSNSMINTYVDGTFEFIDNTQELIEGNNEYEYRYVPDNPNYKVKIGRLKIFVYKAQQLEFSTLEEFEYGKTEAEIVKALKENLKDKPIGNEQSVGSGKVIYNDNKIVAIDKSKISISLSDAYDSSIAGEYQYSISYDDQITEYGKFTLKKRVLVQGTDYNFQCSPVDPKHPEILPSCQVVFTKDEDKVNFDKKFDVVLVSSSPSIPGVRYKYNVELVPDSTIANNIEKSEAIILLDIPKQFGQ